jgi:hypothetical protein
MSGLQRASRAVVRRDITLEALVIWAYRDQRVDRMTAASLQGAERSIELAAPFLASPPSSAALIARLGALGTRVDGGGQSWACHGDAERLHELVCGLAPDAALAILRFGKSGDAPDWQVPDARPQRVPLPEEEPGHVRHKLDVWWYRVAGKRPRLRRGEGALVVQNAAGSWDLGCRYCPITYYPPPEYGAAMRRDYAAWHAAMSLLMAKLGRLALKEHAVTRFAAPARPWEEPG